MQFGYNNAVYLLNDLCNSQYSNSSLGAIGRSINLLDIEKHFNDVGKKARDVDFSNVVNGIYTKYGDTKTYTGDNTYLPDIHKIHDTNMKITPNNIAQITSENCYSAPISITSTKESSLTLIQTAYGMNSVPDYYDNPNFHMLIFGNEISWFATRGILFDTLYTHYQLYRRWQRQFGRM